ncbi:hypothetical protein [Sulfitobacter sp. 1A13679]|jgi:hypothetical protein|uniref:hypothetical protein n=1 Tax=Sulfitobacter TaxID=60136 RepID=UPI00374564D5
MTKSPLNHTKDMIEKAQKGQQWMGYRSDPVPSMETEFSPEEHWQSQLTALCAQWEGSSAEVRAISFVFTDEPYHLSKFVFDAVVVWDEEAFRRVEIGDLPERLRDALSNFQKRHGPELFCYVGDTLMRMADEYSHTLLTGQAYLTMDTLTVLNVWGANCSGVKQLTPALPYAITVLVSGSMHDAAARLSQDTRQGGLLDFLDWTTMDQDQSRVSKSHVRKFIAPPPPLTVPKLDDDLLRELGVM